MPVLAPWRSCYISILFFLPVCFQRPHPADLPACGAPKVTTECQGERFHKPEFVPLNAALNRNCQAREVENGLKKYLNPSGTDVEELVHFS